VDGGVVLTGVTVGSAVGVDGSFVAGAGVVVGVGLTGVAVGEGEASGVMPGLDMACTHAVAASKQSRAASAAGTANLFAVWRDRLKFRLVLAAFKLVNWTTRWRPAPKAG